MFIEKKIYTHLVRNCPVVPPEIGGIIGGSGDTVSTFWIDYTCSFKESARYIPNLYEINKRIADWEKSGIQFLGIFHSHMEGQNTLSGGDRKYIINIMSAMPSKVQYLFFPIVIPEQGVYGFKAIKKEEGIYILSETMITI